MNDWSTDKVLTLAPDSGSASAGQGLANARKWTSLGASDRALWGLCQGSGKDPYQTRIDLNGPVFKCSCPSRKFPCKHGLALLLLFAKDPSQFKKAVEPGWVGEWIAGRNERAEKKAEKASAAAQAPVDVKAQAKRAAQREERVQQGVEECRTWLDDLLRRGLAAAKSDATTECERVAARMVDAQAPGLAGYLRRIPQIMASGIGWEVRTLEFLGRLHLLLSAAGRIGELPEPLADNVRVTLGYNQSKDEVLAGSGVTDTWTVIGQAFEEDDRLTVRRTWLYGRRTDRYALVVDFAVANQPLDTSLVPGMSFDGEIAFYSSGSPLRGLVKTRRESLVNGGLLTDETRHTVNANLERFAKSLATNPWLARWPLLLTQTRLVRAGEKWILKQGEEALRLSPSFRRSIHVWRLLATTGGREATVAVEWDGRYATPIGVFFDADAKMFVSFVSRWVA